MPQVIEMIDRFCIYGVACDYQELVEAVRFRLREIETTHESVDHVSGLHGGYTGKIVAPVPMKSMGKVSMGPILQTLGLRLIIVRDDEMFKRVKDRLAKRERPRDPPNGSLTRPTWLFTRKKSIKMQVLRNQALSPKQRKRIARIAGRASGLARRRRARKSGAAHAQ